MKSIEVGFKNLLLGFVVGDGEKPEAGGWQGAPAASQFVNYLILKPSVGVADGSLAEPDRQIDREFSVSCVAATAVGAGILGDKVRQAVLGKRITTPTRTTTGPITIERYGAIDRDDTVQPHVFFVVHVFNVNTVPL